MEDGLLLTLPPDIQISPLESKDAVLRNLQADSYEIIGDSIKLERVRLEDIDAQTILDFKNGQLRSVFVNFKQSHLQGNEWEEVNPSDYEFIANKANQWLEHKKLAVGNHDWGVVLFKGVSINILFFDEPYVDKPYTAIDIVCKGLATVLFTFSLLSYLLSLIDYYVLNSSLTRWLADTLVDNSSQHFGFIWTLGVCSFITAFVGLKNKQDIKLKGFIPAFLAFSTLFCVMIISGAPLEAALTDGNYELQSRGRTVRVVDLYEWSRHLNLNIFKNSCHLLFVSCFGYNLWRNKEIFEKASA